MKRNKIFIIAILFFISCKEEGMNEVEPTSTPAMLELADLRGLNDFYIEDFRCGVFVPPSYHPDHQYPLIIRLHGYSDLTSWILEYYTDPIVSLDPAIVLTPKCPVSEADGWGESFTPFVSPMLARTFEMIDLARETFNIDESRIYIYGSSMGGYGTYAAIRHVPDLFAAAYVEVGCGDPGMAELIDNIPFWIFHGEWDNVVPVSCARNMMQAVNEIGGKQIRYTEYKGVGHNVWEYTNYENTIQTWLMAQRKGTTVHDPPSGQLDPGFKLEEEGILFTWNAINVFPSSSDDDIWFVEIFKNGELLTEVNSNLSSYLDNEVESGADYEYTFIPVNYFFKRGQQELLKVKIP